MTIDIGTTLKALLETSGWAIFLILMFWACSR